MSRDRAHMSAIGREGGHSRGARARAASQGGDTTSDFTRQETTGNQAFAHETTSERSAFDNTPRPGTSSSQRGNYNSSDRGNGRDRSNERQGDTPSDHRPFSGRDEI